MPDLGFYKERPRPESIDALEQSLRTHRQIAAVGREEPQTLYIRRYTKSDLRVFLTNVYIIGEAEASAILAENPQINAIVTMSGWNSYTADAKSLCGDRGVGLFKFGELLGALNYEGNRFVNYTPPRDEEREQRRRKRRW